MNPVVQNPFTWVYFPTALALGALHALEPGHAKTLTAAYLIGIKGTKRDALLLGLSVAFTHSIVVVGISIGALWLGRETFTHDVTHWLQIGSGVIVIFLGLWMLIRRLSQMRRARTHSHSHGTPGSATMNTNLASAQFQFVRGDTRGAISFKVHKPHGHHHHHSHDHDHDHEHDHAHMTDDEHARAHAATMPEYAKRGERPTLLQIITFGAAGGMLPCPASITVMLLALSIGKFASGALAVAGFSLGLAITLVGIGLIVVAGLSKLQGTGRFHWISSKAPVLSAIVVMLSGCAALLFAH